ncbi:GcrA family cell cycle regulator [Xanthobacter sp. TB0136]|uniref:GcrA family cell cycle regulator n=1 Tax=Xanthobacter sp. TB0136 TaxID=3459177 RepID=UPI0040391AA2
MSWTDERVELLKKLWSEGLSASQIAGELGEVTRNAVIGKVHRLGLSGRAKSVSAPPARPRGKTRPEQAVEQELEQEQMEQQEQPVAPQRPVTQGNVALAPVLEDMVEEAPVARIVEDNVVPMGQGCTIMSLTEYTCRWPIGEPGSESFHFCGARSTPGVPYCAHHARIAYQPVQDRRRDRRLAYL